MKRIISIELESDELGLLYKFLRRTGPHDIEENFAGVWTDQQVFKKNVETTISAIRELGFVIHKSLPENAPELDY